MTRERALAMLGLVLVISCGGSTSPHVDASHDATASDATAHDAATHDATPDDANVGDAAEPVSCDRRPLSCRRSEPECPSGQVVQIIGNCFGPCVPIEQCVCTEAAACPREEMYTCHMVRQRCGPYVQ